MSAIPWAGLLSKSRSVLSPALSSLRLPVQQCTRRSAPCGDCWVGPAADAPAAGFARQTYCLASRVFFILGSFPVLWATKISLEMQLRLTVCRFNESSNPGLFSQRHLESSPQISFILICIAWPLDFLLNDIAMTENEITAS